LASAAPLIIVGEPEQLIARHDQPSLPDKVAKIGANRHLISVESGR
jgi:hypothetical protein